MNSVKFSMTEIRGEIFGRVLSKLMEFVETYEIGEGRRLNVE